jgi:hypothetical protein
MPILTIGTIMDQLKFATLGGTTITTIITTPAIKPILKFFKLKIAFEQVKFL